MNNNQPNRLEWMEVELELLKDRLYNCEEYAKSITTALQKWSDAIEQKIGKIEPKEEDVSQLTITQIMQRCKDEKKTLEIRNGKAYIK